MLVNGGCDLWVTSWFIDRFRNLLGSNMVIVINSEAFHFGKRNHNAEWLNWVQTSGTRNIFKKQAKKWVVECNIFSQPKIFYFGWLANAFLLWLIDQSSFFHQFYNLMRTRRFLTNSINIVRISQTPKPNVKMNFFWYKKIYSFAEVVYQLLCDQSRRNSLNFKKKIRGSLL